MSVCGYRLEDCGDKEDTWVLKSEQMYKECTKNLNKKEQAFCQAQPQPHKEK